MRKPRIPVHLYALAAMLFWGMSFVWSSQLLRSYLPATIIFFRLIISSAFLFAVILISGSREKLERKDYRLVFLSALFNPFLYFLFETYGIKFSTPTIAAVVIALIPVFSPLAAYISFRERLSPLNIAGIAVSFCGVILILVTGDMSLAADIRGIMFLAGAVAAALLYSVTLKKLTLKYSPILLVASQNLIGIFLFLPVFLVFEARQALSVPVTGGNLSSLLFLAILASSLAFVFYAHSVKVLGISKTNIFSNLIPVFTALFSWFLVSEPFTLRKIAGILLVIAGVYLSERTKKRG